MLEVRLLNSLMSRAVAYLRQVCRGAGKSSAAQADLMRSRAMSSEEPRAAAAGGAAAGSRQRAAERRTVSVIDHSTSRAPPPAARAQPLLA